MSLSERNEKHYLYQKQIDMERTADTLLAKMDIIKEGISSIQCQLPHLASLDSINDNLKAIASAMQAEPRTILGMSEGLATIIIPTFTSIIVFLGGILVSKYLKNRENRNRVKSFKESVLFWCEKLIPMLKESQKNLVSSSDRLSSSECFEISPLYLIPNDMGKLNNIPLEKYIFAFKDTSKLKSKNSKVIQETLDICTYSMVSQFEILSIFNQMLRDGYNIYKMNIGPIVDEWNKNNLSGMDIIEKVITKNPNDSEIQKLKSIVDEYTNNELKTDIAVTTDDYVNPILDWCEKNISNPNYGAEAQVIKSKFILLYNLLSAYKHYTLQYSEDVKDKAENLGSVINALDECVKFFSKCGTKYIVRQYI